MYNKTITITDATKEEYYMKKHGEIKIEMTKNYERREEVKKLTKSKKLLEKELIDSVWTKDNNLSYKENMSARNKAIEKIEDKLKQIDDELVTLYVEEETLNEEYTVLKSNYEYSVCKTVVPVICEVMNKYLGKRVGEKTTDKIKNEVYEKTGFRFYWSSSYFTCKLNIHSNNLNADLYVNWTDTNISHFFEEELTEDKIHIREDYVEDIPAYVKQMREERSRLKQAMENLNQMIDKYNEKCVGDMHHYSRYYDR